MKDYNIDYDSMTFDENELAEYITAWVNGVPKWYKIHHNNHGGYIVLDGKRNYVLVNIGE